MGSYRRHNRFFQYVGLALLFLFICMGTGLWNAYADEVILTNGDRISGSVISLSQETVRISTTHSGIMEIDREHIELLNTKNPMVVELVSGERMIGRIGYGDGKTIIVHSSTLGDRELSLLTVSSIRAYLPEENIKKKTTDIDSEIFIMAGGSNSSPSDDEQNDLTEQLMEIRGKGSEGTRTSEGITEKAPETNSQQKPIGSKPEDEEDIRRIFLRQTTVLLRPGVKEIEVGLDYLSNQFPSTLFTSRVRQFLLPLALRIGLIEGLEGNLVIPFTHTEQEISFAGDVTTQKTTGIADSLFGINWEIFRETDRWPDITTVLRVRAPTGDVPQEVGLSTGSGHWAGSFGFQFTKTADPVVLFWGIRYVHAFENSYFFNDAIHEVQPGDTIDYNFGFGFAVNQTVSLSAEVIGGYQWEFELDGQKLPGSSREPVNLRAALTHRISRDTYVEPSLRIGLNDEAADFLIGISATRRFGGPKPPEEEKKE